MSFQQGNTSDTQRSGITFRGQEITLRKDAGRPHTGLMRKGIENGVWPEEKQVEAATLYAVLGNMEKVAEISTVPVKTLHSWRRTEWFKALLKEVWEENNEKIDAKFTSIIEKALDQIVDRLDNGDVTVLKDGKVVRRPISAKDLSLVGAINVDKRQLLRGLPTSRTESSQEADKKVDRLERIAETFENLAKYGRKKVDVIDVVPEPVLLEDNELAPVVPSA